MKKQRFFCIGQYCNVSLEEGVNASSKIYGVTKKSILLDRFEYPKITADDPLGLEKRKFLTLDYLMSRFPNMRPSNFYDICKICQNCELAYSIIDSCRARNLKTLKSPKQKTSVNRSYSQMQTKLKPSQNKLNESVMKFKKKIDDKKQTEYQNMKAILLPIGHSRLSMTAEEIVNSIAPKNFQAENEIKNLKSSPNPVYSSPKKPVCELAMSILRKRINKSVNININRNLPA